MGKSRLATLAADLAEQSGNPVLALIGSPFHTDAGLYPVRALLEQRCGIERLTEHWRRQGEPELHEELLEEVEPEDGADEGDELDPDEDPILRDAITLVAEMQTASTSMLQRRLRCTAVRQL